jgi:geranylgeranyl reductase family protein
MTTSIDHCDALVVGAGPAGCSAAQVLARAGLDVVLLDRAPAPPPKPCAGGLTVKAARVLGPEVVEPVLQRRCRRLVLRLQGARERILEGPGPVVLTTVRADLDARLLELARTAGVRLRRTRHIERVAGRVQRWQLTTVEGVIRSRYLVGADGARSRIRELTGQGGHVTLGLAVQARVPVADPETHPLSLDFGVVPEGYAWIFPCRDHLNVGVYTLRRRLPGARRRLLDFCQAQLHREPVGPITGGHIARGGYAYRHRPDRALLVGDAAGLVDPLLGEGIHNAARSGQLAAAAILQMEGGEPDRYGQLVREVTGDLASYRFEASLFYRHLRLGYRHLTAAPIRYALLKGFAMGMPVRQIKRRAPLLPLLRYRAPPP